jgi:2-keto-4-pentenoate hydratase/2-oxohepta-3-ene-1,7-dioic acid hydratase in catechol pathway
MYLASYKYDEREEWGVVDALNKMVYPSNSVFSDDKCDTLLEYIQKSGCDSFRKIDLSDRDNGIPLDSVKLLAPITKPIRNIFCIGKNYLEHIKELSGYDKKQFDLLAEKPIFFTKSSSTINGPYDNIPEHVGITNAIDYEAELAVIIGNQGTNIKVADVLDYVFGYTILNDVTARDLQKDHKQWFKGKSLDGFCPIGPWIVTRDEIEDVQSLGIKSYVNGDIRQDSNTSNMMFSVAVLIEELSKGMTLMPGDIIATGTPSGVGAGMNPPQFLKHDDCVNIIVENIGEIKNSIG